MNLFAWFRSLAASFSSRGEEAAAPDTDLDDLLGYRDPVDVHATSVPVDDWAHWEQECADLKDLVELMGEDR